MFYADSVLIFTKIWGLIYVLVALTTGEQNYPLLVIDQCASGTTGGHQNYILKAYEFGY